MNFWERVDDLLERKDKNKKALAKEAGFDPSNISKGIKNGNIPAADTALKIANIRENKNDLEAQTREKIERRIKKLEKRNARIKLDQDMKFSDQNSSKFAKKHPKIYPFLTPFLLDLIRKYKYLAECWIKKLQFG